MRLPPYLLKLEVRNRSHSFAIWLPLFLVWPLALALLLAAFLIMLPFALLSMIFTWQLGYWRPMVLGIPAIFRLLCSLPGLNFDIRSAESHFEIRFM